MHTIIHWFRQDLRLKDNPALSEAAKAGRVIPIYILDDKQAGAYALGGASRLWLHHSLNALNKSLEGRLCVFSGDTKKIIARLVSQHGVKAVYWNRCYEPWRIEQDKAIKTHLEKQGVAVHTYNASLLWEPWVVLKEDKTPYKVFTAFYKAALYQQPVEEEIRAYLLKKPVLKYVNSSPKGEGIDALTLEPVHHWKKSVLSHWAIGEQAAASRLTAFLNKGIAHYQQGRDFPGQLHVSRLSPHLHFGEISPHRVWHRVSLTGSLADKNVSTFLSELGWREFSYYLLYHFPQLPKKNLQPKFDRFPWRKSTSLLEAWQRGMTGYPIVDAGMRQLWQTGWMHNRVRMIVGSFLVKNLGLHWHQGERWFWDCLVDADLASNSAGWQWVTGCGVDAAPYFRVFNPVLQGKKFDTNGNYTRHYVPELSALPDKYLFNPWEAPEPVLKKAGIVLGKTYPRPLVDLQRSRQQALAAFKGL